MITRGEFVLFTPHTHSTILRGSDGRCLALVVEVLDEHKAMLTVFAANGHSQPAAEVPFLQPNDPRPAAGYFCERKL